MSGADDILRRALRMWPDRPAKVLFRTQEAVLVRRAPLPDPAVDLGSGSGEFVVLAGLRPAVAVDRSVRACARATASGHYTAVVNADITRLPLASGSFASALANTTLEHLDDPASAIAEAARVLQPAGCLVVTVPTPRKRNWLSIAEYAESVLDDAELAERYRQAFDTYWAHRHYFQPHDLVGLFDRAGLDVVDLVEYEPAHLSRLLDPLNHLRVTHAVEAAPELADLVAEATAALAGAALTPFLNANPARPGAGVLCRGIKR